MSGAEQPAPAAIPDEGIKEKDPILVEINKKIESAFDIFDHESNKTVDVRYTQIKILSIALHPNLLQYHCTQLTLRRG